MLKKKSSVATLISCRLPYSWGLSQELKKQCPTSASCLLSSLFILFKIHSFIQSILFKIHSIKDPTLPALRVLARKWGRLSLMFNYPCHHWQGVDSYFLLWHGLFSMTDLKKKSGSSHHWPRKHPVIQIVLVCKT